MNTLEYFAYNLNISQSLISVRAQRRYTSLAILLVILAPMTPAPFSDRVTERTRHKETRLCIGLDPRAESYKNTEQLRQHTLEVLEATAPYAACIKPQLAFFEALRLEGFVLLKEVCEAARSLDLPVILDGKRGDIGSTAQAYAKGWMRGFHAGDALTVNPFLGFETLEPFLEAARQEGGMIFALVKTSNAGQADLQGEGISEKVAAHLKQLNSQAKEFGEAGAVVGATHPEDLARMRQLMPKTILLLPGLGAQGGSAHELAPAFIGGVGALASASRAIQYPQGIEGSHSAVLSREAAKSLRDELNRALC